MNIQILSNLGLTDNESQIYLAFLYEGETTAADISRKINLDKSSTYRAVESLQKKQLLISSPKKKGTTYTPVDPQALQELFQKKQQDLASQETVLTSFIDKIQKDISHKKLPQTNITVEKGYDAIIAMHEHKLKVAESNSPKLIRERWHTNHPIVTLPKYEKYIKNYAKRRIAKNIHIHAMYNSFDEKNPISDLLKTSKKYKKEVRLWPKELENNHMFITYGNYVSFISSDTNNDFLLITIREAFLVETINSLYDYVWNRAEIII